MTVPISPLGNNIKTSQPSIVCRYDTHGDSPFCDYVPPVESGGFEGFVSPDYRFEEKKNSPPPPYSYEYLFDKLRAYLDSQYSQPYDTIFFARYPFVHQNIWQELYGIPWARVHTNHKRFSAYRVGTFTTYVVDPVWFNTVYTYYHGGSYSYNVCYNMIFKTKIFYADGIPNHSLAFTSFCLGHEILFNTNCDTNQTYFHWDFGDGHSATGPIVRHTYAAPGCYTVQTIIDYANTPLSDHSRDTLIGSITISPRDTVTYYDSCCIFPYQWGDTLISSPGAHLRYSNNIGNCLPVHRLILSVDTSSVTTYFSDTICQDDQVPWGSYTCTAPGSYRDTLLQINGCDSILLLNLSVWSYPDVTINRLTPPDQFPIQLQGSVHNNFGHCHFTWNSSPTDASLQGQEHSSRIMVSPTENTLYSLTAEYDSLPGCYGQTHYIAVLLENNNLWIPNVFTPGRESNNTFSVNANELSYYHITIFNRLGMKVFHSDDINQPWDGTCDGLPCPTGTYTYTIDYSTNNSPNELLHHTGTVTLIR